MALTIKLTLRKNVVLAGTLTDGTATLDGSGAWTGVTSITAGTSVITNLIDTTGAADIDIGSADVTDVTIITDGGADSLTIGNNADLDFGITFDSDTDDATINWDEANSELEIDAPNYRFGANADEDIVIVLDSDTNDATITYDEDNDVVNFGGTVISASCQQVGASSTPYTVPSTAYCLIIYNDVAGVLEVDLPDTATDRTICVHADDQASAITIDPNGTDVIRLDGASESAGEAIDNTGSAAVGDYICVHGRMHGDNC